ncbi:MAG: SLC13 family permease [Hyphomicrobium sp.]
MSDLSIDPKLAIAAILAVTLGLFVWGRWRYDLVALGALLAGVLTGAVKPDAAFVGFADPAVVTVALVLVLSAAIRQSGVLDRALGLLGPVVDDPRLQIVVFTTAVAALSAFMNNVGALAVVMPLAIAAAERSGRSPSLLLMPIAFGSLLGGLVTLIGTPPNLLISNIRRDATGQPFDMFDFAPVGLAVAVAGVVYLCFAWRLLPADRRGAPSPQSKFRVSDFVTEARVPEGSRFAGKTVADIEALGEDDVTVVAITSAGRTLNAPPRSWRIAEGDILIIESDAERLKRIVDQAALELVGDKELAPEHASSREIGTVEVVVTAGSDLIGQSPQSLKLRDMGLNLLAMSRQGRRRTDRMSRERFREGDVLAVQGDLDHLAFMIRELALLPLASRGIDLGRRNSANTPVVVMAAAVLAAASGYVPIAIAFLAAVVVLGVARVMRPGEMYEAIDPSIIILMAALMPVTTAVQTSGGTDVIAGLIAGNVAGASPIAALSLFLFATMAVTPVLNNAATVLLMGPIAALFASKAGLNPDSFLMAVAIGASCDFLTPFGHQSNTLVMGPGGYKFMDYPRMGFPLTLIVAAVSIPMIALVWPLKPL